MRVDEGPCSPGIVVVVDVSGASGRQLSWRCGEAKVRKIWERRNCGLPVLWDDESVLEVAGLGVAVSVSVTVCTGGYP